MKEVTYEDWLKNPTPRLMWVWDFDEGKKQKQKVIYLSKEDVPYKVITIAARDTVLEKFLHCAEIAEQRLMTKKELSRWLREKPTREFKYGSYITCSVYSTYTYNEDDGDEEVRNDIVIRENDGEWREPLVGIKKFRRMTYKELSRWLREKPTREYTYSYKEYIGNWCGYTVDNQDNEVTKDVFIREDGGEWKEPLVEEIE